MFWNYLGIYNPAWGVSPQAVGCMGLRIVKEKDPKSTLGMNEWKKLALWLLMISCPGRGMAVQLLDRLKVEPVGSTRLNFILVSVSENP